MAEIQAENKQLFECIAELVNIEEHTTQELRDLIIVILTSFVYGGTPYYYESRHKKVSSRYIECFAHCARSVLGDDYNDSIKVIEKTDRQIVFKTCKAIFSRFEKDTKFIVDMFTGGEKYIIRRPKKRELILPPEIIKLMNTELDNIIRTRLNKSSDDELTIYNPCFGRGDLLPYFVDKYPKLRIRGCEKDYELAAVIKINHIISGRKYEDIIEGDYVNEKRDLRDADVAICDPPYGRNTAKPTTKHTCLNFVNKSLEHVKYCCYLMPRQKLYTETKALTALLEKHTILKIINIGDIFKAFISTGELILMIAAQGKQETKTVYVDLSDLGNEYKKINRKEDEYKFTPAGIEILENYYNNYEIITDEFILTVGNPYPAKRTITTLERIKKNYIKEYRNEINRLDNIYMSAGMRKALVDNYNACIEEINNCPTMGDIIKLGDASYSFNWSGAKYIRLMDYFEQIKFNPLKPGENKPGEYPLFGSTDNNNPIEFTETYTIDTNGEDWMQVNRNSFAGCCYVRNGKFSLNQYCSLLKLKDEYKNIFNIEENIKLLTLQMTNMGYSYMKPINNERINDIFVYAFIKDATK